MRVNRALLGWGIFLVVLGGIPLAVRLGGVQASALSDAWRLWPLIIIGAGIAVLLRRTAWSLVGGLLVAGTIGVVAGSILATGGTPTGTCSTDNVPSEYTRSSGTFTGPASVSLSIDCGKRRLDRRGSSWSTQIGQIGALTPEVRSESNRLVVESKTRSNAIGADQPGDDWTVVLPTDVETSLTTSLNLGRTTLDLSNGRFDALSVSTNLGDMRLDLTGATARALTFTTNLGSGSLTLPDTSMTATVSSNLGSLKICVPSGVGLRVATSSDALASINWDGAGLSKVDGTHYQTSGYASAVNRIEMTLTANLGSVTFNPSGGCR